MFDLIGKAVVGLWLGGLIALLVLVVRPLWRRRARQCPAYSPGAGRRCEQVAGHAGDHWHARRPGGRGLDDLTRWSPAGPAAPLDPRNPLVRLTRCEYFAGLDTLAGHCSERSVIIHGGVPLCAEHAWAAGVNSAEFAATAWRRAELSNEDFYDGRFTPGEPDGIDGDGAR